MASTPAIKQANNEITPLSIEEIVRSLRPDAPTRHFTRFSQWTWSLGFQLDEKRKRKLPIFITDPVGNKHQLEFSWYEGGYEFSVDHLVFASNEAAEAADAPCQSEVIALEDTTGHCHVLSPLGRLASSTGGGWALFWALEQQQYWIVFNWDKPAEGFGFCVEEPSERLGTFQPTDVVMSYCQLSDFSFSTWSGKMENIRTGGFSVHQVTRKDGVLVPLEEGVPAPPREYP
jgi:hypothetical protein